MHVNSCSSKIFNQSSFKEGLLCLISSASRKARMLQFIKNVGLYTWDKHTTLIEGKGKDLTEVDFNQAALQIVQTRNWQKKLLMSMRTLTVHGIGEVGPHEMVQLLLSRKTRGKFWMWCLLDERMHAKQCKEIEGNRVRGEFGRLDYISWYIAHEPNCLLNHEESAQVRKFYFYYSRHSIYI